MKRPQKLIWSTLAAAAIATGSYFGSFGLHIAPAFAQDAATAKPTPQPQPEAVAPAYDLSHAFRTVHNAIKDAVVNIDITKKVAAEDGASLNGIDPQQLPPEFRRMLPPNLQQSPDDNGDRPARRGQAPQETERGTGSGVIISADGYILTNNHVVDGADDITVRLNDGREIKATVVGTDPKTDLAVVRIKADHLTYAKFGDSDATQVGDWVLAFGSPFTFDQTMTQGIISAKGRHVPIIAEHNPKLQGYTYEDFLQTDAAINPGNSGGPLVNLQGEVIGINTAIASNTGAYNGIGFSIPSNEAKYIMESLIKHGSVVRGYLGAMIEDVNHPAPEDKPLLQSIRDSGFKADTGVLIAGITPSSPGGKGGLQLGDVVTSMDGKPVGTSDDFRNEIARYAPGTKVTLSIFRDGKNMDVTFPLGTQPDARAGAQLASATVGQPDQADAASLGVTVQSLTDSNAKRYNAEPGKGVVVTNVTPDSTAATLGLQPGDVITKVGKEDVNSPADLSSALSKDKLSSGVRMTIRTVDGTERLVFVKTS